MKSVGEVMSIGRSFEEAFQKALRMSEETVDGFVANPTGYKFRSDKWSKSRASLEDELMNPTDQRMFALATALHIDGEHFTVDRLHTLTNIDCWFLHKFLRIIELSKQLESIAGNVCFAFINKFHLFFYYPCWQSLKQEIGHMAVNKQLDF